MRWFALTIAGIAALLGLAYLGWNAVRHAPAGELSVEWAPALQLSPGISIREGKVAAAPVWRVLDLSLDPARAVLRVGQKAGGGMLSQMIPAGAVAAVNGGYFDERLRPTGWLVDQSRDLAPKQSRSQGGVLAMKAGALYIGPMGQVPFAPEFAVQNSPRLVEPGGKMGIRRDDHKRASRTLACDTNGRLHLIAISAPPGEGPTLFEAASFLAREPELGGMGCGAALNLDGGPSTAMWLPASVGIAAIPGAAAIAYGIAVLPR